MREELAGSRAIIEAHIGKPALHLPIPSAIRPRRGSAGYRRRKSSASRAR